jgi:hypothetical protein
MVSRWPDPKIMKTAVEELSGTNKKFPDAAIAAMSGKSSNVFSI